jgi:hypothetical protein
MNFLVSGIGGPTPIGIAKSLRLNNKYNKIKIIGMDGNKLAPGLYNKDVFDKTYLVPNSSSSDYWTKVEEIIALENIEIAFIVPEVEVIEWSRRKMSKGLPCKSFIPDLEISNVLYNKYSTFDLLKETELVPNTYQIDKNLLDETLIKLIGFPFWIRAGSGAGAIGSLKISDMKTLKNWMMINPSINDFLGSEYLPGKNYACKVLFHQGKLVRASCAERITYLMSNAAPSGISGMSAHGKLINNSELIKISERALQIIFSKLNKRLEGMFTVDLKEDKHGKAKITEINIRHVSFSHAFALAGANFAQDTVELLNESNEFDTNYKEYSFEKDYLFIRGVDSQLFIIEQSDLK